MMTCLLYSEEAYVALASREIGDLKELMKESSSVVIATLENVGEQSKGTVSWYHSYQFKIEKVLWIDQRHIQDQPSTAITVDNEHVALINEGTLLTYKSSLKEIKRGDRLIVFLWFDPLKHNWRLTATEAWEPIQNLEKVTKLLHEFNN